MTSTMHIQTWLLQRVAKSANLPERELDLTAPISRYGLDSSTLLEISCDLEDWLNLDLPPTTLQDHPSIEQLAGHLAGLLEVRS